MASAEAAAIAVEVAWSPAPRALQRATLRLPAGATVRDAALAAGAPVPAAAAGDGPPAWTCAVWGRACAPERVLRDGDRVELLRPLEVAPMDARRARYRRSGGVQAIRARNAKPPKGGAARG
jgi:putative ubiquitin-RnfH superfamily antitoxin RatB of RatAB toxin-antitoxin module